MSEGLKSAIEGYLEGSAVSRRRSFSIFPSYTHHIYEESTDKARSLARLKNKLTGVGGVLEYSTDQEFKVKMYEADLHKGFYIFPMSWLITVRNKPDTSFVAVEVLRSSERRFSLGFFCLAIVIGIISALLDGKLPNIIFMLVCIYTMAWFQSKVYLSPAYYKLRNMIEASVAG